MQKATRLTLKRRSLDKFLKPLSQGEKKHLLPALNLIINAVDGYNFQMEMHEGSLYFLCGVREGGKSEPFYYLSVTVEPNQDNGYTVRLDIHSHTDGDSCGIEWNARKGTGWAVWYPCSLSDRETRRFRALQERMQALHGNREIRLGRNVAGQLMNCMLRAAAR